MSASERFATMPIMTALSRAGFLPPCGLKSASCLCRYSGIWPAILGLAGAVLLPSAAWHAAHTWFGDGLRLRQRPVPGPARLNTAAAAPHTNARIIPWPPESSKGAILLDYFRKHSFSRRPAGPPKCRRPDRPELAFAGRSNVGKSSAINALAGRKRLAFTSKTPGRTQTINFYELARRRTARSLVDLPGYGYARVPQALRAAVEGTCRRLPEVAPVARRRGGDHGCAPSAHRARRAAARLARRHAQAGASLESGQAFARGAGRDARRKSRAAFGPKLILFSSVTRQGVDECRGLLECWLEQARRNKKPPVKGI